MVGDKTISFNLKKPYKSDRYFLDIYDDEMKPIVKSVAVVVGANLTQGVVNSKLPEGYIFVVIPSTLYGLKNELVYPNFKDNYKLSILEVEDAV